MSAAHPDWRYLVVGGGPEQVALGELARSLGIADRVRFTGFVGNACEYTAALDAFAFPSVREGSPGVVKEAMALRVPVVAANAPGTDEVVTPETGVLVPPQDPVAMAAALDAVMTSASATTAMVDRAHVHVQQNFSMQRTVEATVSIYESVRKRAPIACGHIAHSFA